MNLFKDNTPHAAFRSMDHCRSCHGHGHVDLHSRCFFADCYGKDVVMDKSSNSNPT